MRAVVTFFSLLFSFYIFYVYTFVWRLEVNVSVFFSGLYFLFESYLVSY